MLADIKSGGAGQGWTGQQPARLRVTTELVLVNVVVRDKKGNAISNLKKEDFTVFEDGQKQQISSFDFENVNALTTAGTAGPTVTGAAGTTGSLWALRHRRHSRPKTGG